MLVPMELSRIIISDLNEQQVVWLREIDGPRSFAIVIGIFEAASINRHVKGEEAPRPLTHDLLCSVVEGLGGVLEDVVITNLQDHTYYALLRIRHNGDLVEIDSRPSDAIALAVHYKPALPIFVDDSVLEQAANA
ncbi:MAG: bifunctional nuclease family protein [Planctomycetota bacterium]|nr:bifunctional nuclease family protein [Planctomycetota bacterium]